MEKLIINGIVYAEYEIKNRILYYVTTNPIIKGSENVTESLHLAIKIIHEINNRNFDEWKPISFIRNPLLENIVKTKI